MRGLVNRIRPGDRGSLPLALLVVIVGMGIAATLIPLAVTQIHTTSFDRSRTVELHAAETGVSVAVGLIRSATDGAAGSVAKLPCTTGRDPLTGTAAGGDSRAYTVRIDYYVTDPADKPDDWLAPYGAATPGGHAMTCSIQGPFLIDGAPGAAGGMQRVPGFAVITATGTDGRASRTLRTVYTVKTSNANVAGGGIYLWSTSVQKNCMTAGAVMFADPSAYLPKAGDVVSLQPCGFDPTGKAAVTRQQGWAYRTDLAIQLVASTTVDNPDGLCVTADGSAAAGNEQPGQAMRLVRCQPLGQAPWNHLWSIDDATHLQGATNTAPTSDATLNKLCITGRKLLSELTLATCSAFPRDLIQSWVASPDAGSGKAQLAAAADDSTPIQYVDYGQFSRCIDVTSQATGLDNGSGSPGGAAFLIGFTCKQSPNQNAVTWNQKFAYRGGQLVTSHAGDFCVTSPLRPYADPSQDSPSGGPFVNVTPCPKPGEAATTWYKLGADGKPQVTSPQGRIGRPYEIQDSRGNCLSMTTNTAVAYTGYPKLIVAACDGSKLQMWNAWADVKTPGLSGYREIPTP